MRASDWITKGESEQREQREERSEPWGTPKCRGWADEKEREEAEKEQPAREEKNQECGVLPEAK